MQVLILIQDKFMTFYREALLLDIAKKYPEAIEKYEQALENGEQNIEIYLNLSFIYFQVCTEFVWRFDFNISEDVFDNSYNKVFNLLELANTIHPNKKVCFNFLKEYFTHRILFDDFTEEDVLAIMGDSKQSSLLPYMLLYLFDMKKYKQQRDLLLAECRKELTAKNLYIISLIEDRAEQI
jgi:tetratricopeptide (TPR) repeat protein